jgi:hypothetical protein
MDPLSTYQERLPQVRRRFDLYRDRVLIEARWLLRGQYTNTIQLRTLDPQYRVIWIRNKLFKPAMAVLLVGLAITFLAGGVEQLRALSPLPVCGVALTCLGVVMSWLTARRVRFAIFEARGGGRGLDIGCAGPDAREFDTFVAEVQRRVRKSV